MKICEGKIKNLQNFFSFLPFSNWNEKFNNRPAPAKKVRNLLIYFFGYHCDDDVLTFSARVLCSELVLQDTCELIRSKIKNVKCLEKQFNSRSKSTALVAVQLLKIIVSLSLLRTSIFGNYCLHKSVCACTHVHTHASTGMNRCVLTQQLPLRRIEDYFQSRSNDDKLPELNSLFTNNPQEKPQR